MDQMLKKQRNFVTSWLSSDMVYLVIKSVTVIDVFILFQDWHGRCFRMLPQSQRSTMRKLHAVNFLQRLLVVQPLVHWRGGTVDLAVSSVCFPIGLLVNAQCKTWFLIEFFFKKKTSFLTDFSGSIQYTNRTTSYAQALCMIT